MFIHKIRQSLHVAALNYRLLIVYLISVILAGYLAALPALRHLDDVFQHRPAAAEIFPGIRTLYFVQWMRSAYRHEINVLVISYFIAVGVIIWLIHLIWSGGLLKRTYELGPGPHTLTRIFESGWSVFLRQLAAWPLWGVFSGAVAGVAWTGGHQFVQYLIRTQQDEWITPALLSLMIGGFVILYLLSILWDLCRIEAIRPGLNPATALFRALFMMLRDGPYYLLLLVVYRSLELGVLFIGYKISGWVMTLPPRGAVELILIVHFLMLAGRLWSRFGLWIHLAGDFHIEDFEKVARPEGVEPPTL